MDGVPNKDNIFIATKKSYMSSLVLDYERVVKTPGKKSLRADSKIEMHNKFCSKDRRARLAIRNEILQGRWRNHPQDRLKTPVTARRTELLP